MGCSADGDAGARHHRADAVGDLRHEVRLTPEGSHLWRPCAPVARIAVDLTQGHRWQGHDYFDANFGTRAPQADFSHWTCGRFPLSSGAACFHDARRRDGAALSLGLHATPDGTATAPPPSPASAAASGRCGAKPAPTRAPNPGR